jgi:hypothetical protein
MSEIDWSGFLEENSPESTSDMPLPFWGRLIIQLLGEIMTQSGATQAQVEAVAQAIAANTAAWTAWASNVETVLSDVETALTAAQNANPAIDLADVTTSLTAAQTAVSALPAETDPTVPPAPAPTPAPGT